MTFPYFKQFTLRCRSFLAMTFVYLVMAGLVVGVQRLLRLFFLKGANISFEAKAIFQRLAT